jgi:hypothetical protein
MVPGIIVTPATASIVLYTSLVLWLYCLKHPELRDICDVGQKLFGGSQIAYNVTSLFFILNNTFIQGSEQPPHFSPTLTHLSNSPTRAGRRRIAQHTGSSLCTVVFAVIAALMSFVVSLPRTLSQLSHMGVFSAATMGLAVLLSIIFAGVQKRPFGYILGYEFIPFVSYVNQTLSGYRQPIHSRTRLWIPPASLQKNRIFVCPTHNCRVPIFGMFHFVSILLSTHFCSSILQSVTSRFIFFRVFKHSRHLHSNSVIAWVVWIVILATTWAIAFLFA